MTVMKCSTTLITDALSIPVDFAISVTISAFVIVSYVLFDDFPNAKLIKIDEKPSILYMVKRRKQGHYCRICGEYKANEKFSCKGHAQHICKSCKSKMKESAVICDDNSGLFVDDSVDEWNEIHMGDMYEQDYNPISPYIDVRPQSEPEHKKYSKLNKEEKSALKELWVEIVTQYWREKHQIPFGEQYSRLKKELLVILEEQGGISLKDDKDLKTLLYDSMTITINKILKMSKD